MLTLSSHQPHVQTAVCSPQNASNVIYLVDDIQRTFVVLVEFILFVLLLVSVLHFFFRFFLINWNVVRLFPSHNVSVLVHSKILFFLFCFIVFTFNLVFFFTNQNLALSLNQVWKSAHQLTAYCLVCDGLEIKQICDCNEKSADLIIDVESFPILQYFCRNQISIHDS